MADNTQRFSDRVTFYTRARPGYPAAMVKFVREEFRLSTDHVVADIGSGTGLLAEPFLADGLKVIGVEPNGPMREASVGLLKGRPNFSATDGTAEATGLADGSVDLVTAGQAFHWFDPEKARAEFRRILRGDKPVALVWNERRSNATGFTAAYQTMIDKHAADRSAVVTREASVEYDRMLERFFIPGSFRLAKFDNPQSLDLDGVLNRIASSSYMPLPPDPRHDAVMTEARDLFDRHQVDGLVRIDHETRAYLGNV